MPPQLLISTFHIAVIYGRGKQFVSETYKKVRASLTALTKPPKKKDANEPRYICGTSAAVMFAMTSLVVHPAAMCTAASSVIYHIAYPDNQLAYLLDLTCNTMTAIHILPHLPATSWLILGCSGVNWALFRHTHNSQWQHVLQVTLPLCVICYT